MNVSFFCPVLKFGHPGQTSFRKFVATTPPLLFELTVVEFATFMLSTFMIGFAVIVVLIVVLLSFVVLLSIVPSVDTFTADP